MKIVTIIGARPQFIKAAAVSGQSQENMKKSLSIQGSILTRICRMCFLRN